jgi:hypothetical protein
MPPDSRIFGADRIVVYLPAATETLKALDGSREKGIRDAIEGFLDSPESVFNKHPREYIGQIRDLDTNTRAFASWCQNQTLDKELCVVHEVYQKKNEGEYWGEINDLNENGSEFSGAFVGLIKSEYGPWRDKVASDPDTIFTSTD